MRLITRGDLDGLTSAVLLTFVENIEEIELPHPKDMQDGLIKVTPNDIIVTLPYHPNCGMWFDHHISQEKNSKTYKFKGKYSLAPSAARLIYEYYDHPDFPKYQELVEETDRVDSATLNLDDVIDPKRWVLISYTIDPRSGLGSFKDYFMQMIDWIKTYPVEELLNVPEVKVRCNKILSEQENFEKLLSKHSRSDGNVIITDFRGIEEPAVGNRFLVYALFPQGNISIRIFYGKNKEFVVAALGHSIFNKTSKTDVGNLLAGYGGGGHKGAGTCQLPLKEADKKIAEIIARMKKDG